MERSTRCISAEFPLVEFLGYPGCSADRNPSMPMCIGTPPIPSKIEVERAKILSHKRLGLNGVTGFVSGLRYAKTVYQPHILGCSDPERIGSLKQDNKEK